MLCNVSKSQLSYWCMYVSIQYSHITKRSISKSCIRSGFCLISSWGLVLTVSIKASSWKDVCLGKFLTMNVFFVSSSKMYLNKKSFVSAMIISVSLSGSNFTLIEQDGWMDSWMDRCMDRWMDGSIDGRTDGLMDGWMHKWM